MSLFIWVPKMVLTLAIFLGCLSSVGVGAQELRAVGKDEPDLSEILREFQKRLEVVKKEYGTTQRDLMQAAISQHFSIRNDQGVSIAYWLESEIRNRLIDLNDRLSTIGSLQSFLQEAVINSESGEKQLPNWAVNNLNDQSFWIKAFSYQLSRLEKKIVLMVKPCKTSTN